VPLDRQTAAALSIATRPNTLATDMRMTRRRSTAVIITLKALTGKCSSELHYYHELAAARRLYIVLCLDSLLAMLLPILGISLTFCPTCLRLLRTQSLKFWKCSETSDWQETGRRWVGLRWDGSGAVNRA